MRLTKRGLLLASQLLVACASDEAFVATDVDGRMEALTWSPYACYSMGSATGLPPAASFDASSGWMVISPPAVEPGVGVVRRSADFVAASGAVSTSPLAGARARELQARGTILDTPAGPRAGYGERYQNVRSEFVYQGATSALRALGSGRVREQMVLKLRARDACNVIYASYRFRDQLYLSDAETQTVEGSRRASRSFVAASVALDAQGFASDGQERITYQVDGAKYYVKILYEAADLYRTGEKLYYDRAPAGVQVVRKAFLDYPPRLSVQIKSNPSKSQSSGASGCGNDGYYNPAQNEVELATTDANGVRVADATKRPLVGERWNLEAETWDSSSDGAAAQDNRLSLWLYKDGRSRDSCPSLGAAGNCLWNGYVDSGAAASVVASGGNAGFRSDNVQAQFRLLVYTPEYYKYAGIGTVREGACFADD